jgi:hypothetical protein
MSMSVYIRMMQCMDSGSAHGMTGMPTIVTLQVQKEELRIEYWTYAHRPHVIKRLCTEFMIFQYLHICCLIYRTEEVIIY